MLPEIHIFGARLPTYGLLSVFGAAICFFYLLQKYQKYQIARDDMVHSLLFASIGAMVGGKLLFLVTIFPYYSALFEHYSIAEVLTNLLTQGFVFYGGLIGALLMVLLYCRMYQISFSNMMYMAAPAFPLFHFFGRIGCFLAGCCHGIPVSWGIAYHNSLGNVPNGVPLLPVQLIEAGGNLLLFLLLNWMQNRKKEGNLIGIYLVAYSMMRFILEFFRGDKLRGIFWGLSTSQWIALAIVISVPIFLCIKKGRKQAASFPNM